MANRKSRSNAQSAPRDKRLAAFSARIDAQLKGTATGLATALDKPTVIKRSTLWLKFTHQVTRSQHGQIPMCRVLPSAYNLPPLP